MAYISKETLLSALNYINRAEIQVSIQCMSALQYWVALDRYYHNNESKEQTQTALQLDNETEDSSFRLFLDGSSKTAKKEFISYVSDVISLDDGSYFKSFKEIYGGNKTIQGTIQSNFFGGSSVEISRNSPEKVVYPQQGDRPLLYALKGGVYREEQYYKNLNYYLTTQTAKFAFALWLLRKEEIDPSFSINDLRELLASRYTQLFVDTLLPSTDLTINDIQELSELSTSDIIAKITKSDIKINPSTSQQPFMRQPLQQIYFGTPGSGKSWTIKRQYEMRKDGETYVEDEEKKKRVIRTTFHPDTDYASFVGCYKPVKDEEDSKKIVYNFVPQAFTDAYVEAWSDLEHPYYLIIEEINRGNCAQIFGDLFQLLDRNKDGYSEYPIKADHDLKNYLVEHLPEDNEGIKDGRLCLPPNLSIIASMNTSDQSLFPMDSAFKRRWSWEYVPIDYKNAKSGEFTITIGNEPPYIWHEFLMAVNNEIKKVTASEDKQMGNFFIKNSVGEKEFCDKVMFYLWSEVGKDNYKTSDAIFKWRDENGTDTEFSFNELYTDGKNRTKILNGFIKYIKEVNKQENAAE